MKLLVILFLLEFVTRFAGIIITILFTYKNVFQVPCEIFAYSFFH